MLFLDEIKDVTKESELYKHIVKVKDNLEKIIEVQYSKRNTLTQILDEIANIENVNLEDTQNLLSVIEDIRNILTRINYNTDGIKTLLDYISGIQDRLDNIIDQNIADELLNKDMKYFFILYIEKINIIEDTNLSYEKIIMKACNYIFLLASKSNKEEKDENIMDLHQKDEFTNFDTQTETVEPKSQQFREEGMQDAKTDANENNNVFKNFKIDQKSEEEETLQQEENIDKFEEKDIFMNDQKDESNIKDNNVLMISEVQNSVFLPYKIKDIKRKYKENYNQYNSIQEVIKTEYIVPLNKYKNPVISRFKEAYNLMREKENATFSESLDLALEVTFKSNLNPAVITACRDLNELDQYLDCLEENNLEKFNIFKVEYEALPKIK